MRISCVNFDKLMNLRQRKENSVKGGDGSGAIVRVKTIGKLSGDTSE